MADVLRKMVTRATDLGLVEGFTTGREDTIVSHLQFADDTMFFVSRDEEKFYNLANSLVSGLKVNMWKCVDGINLDEQKLGVFAGSLICEVGKWPMEYLGLLLGGSPLSLAFWEPVIEKVKKRLNGWKKGFFFFSRGGRLTLVQSVN